jgi:hypothetical protein
MLLTSAPSFFGGSWCHWLWVPLFMMYMPFPYHPPPSTASLYLPMPSCCLTDVMFVALSPVHSWLIRHLVTCLRNVQRFLFPLPVMLSSLWCCVLGSPCCQRILCQLQCNIHWKSGPCCRPFSSLCVWDLCRLRPFCDHLFTLVLLFSIFFALFCLLPVHTVLQSPTSIQIFAIDILK